MPLEFAAEMLLRFVFEVVFYAIGYCTGWLLVPALTFGYFSVEPLAPPKRGVRRIRTVRAAVPRQLSADATAIAGLLVWLVVGGMFALAWWVAKP